MSEARSKLLRIKIIQPGNSYKTKPDKRHSLSKIIKKFSLGLLITLLVFLVIVPSVTYLSFAQDLTDKKSLVNSNDAGILIYDQNDKLIYTFNQPKYKSYVTLDQIPQHLQHALIAVEDKEFYSHDGFSTRGIVRSLLTDIKEGDFVAGGSTITQQLVKNTMLTPDKSLIRKYKEIVLATKIENEFSKNEILEMYFNAAYFGEGAYGINDAAKRYFNKTPQNLTIAESAMLVGLLPSPNALSPLTGDYLQSKNRQQLVLQKMYEQGYINEEQRQDAQQEKLVFQKGIDTNDIEASHFAHLVYDQLVEIFGEEHVKNAKLEVKTTIDIEQQKYAQKSVKNQVEKLKTSGVTNGAAVVMDPKTGAVLALVGSKDWNDPQYGKVNVTVFPRQPGSAFKPIVYAAALEKHLITPATQLKDAPITYRANIYSESYRPQNYDRKFRGIVTVRRALANSLNVPSVEILSKLGVDSAVEMSKRLGLTTIEDADQYGLSLVLGAGEVRLLDLTNAYAVFANNGQKVKPTFIKEVSENNQVIFQHTPDPEPVLEPAYAFLITSILSDKQARKEVFGSVLDTSRPAAVKTGTSENYRDSLTVGFTPSLVVGVWVGNNDGKPMNTIAGSLGAAPIWKDLLETFSKGKSVENFEPVAGVVAVPKCGVRHVLTSSEQETSNQNVEYFALGTAPKEGCVKAPARSTATPSASPSPSPNSQTSPSPVPEISAPDVDTIIRQVEEDNKELKKEQRELEKEIEKLMKSQTMYKKVIMNFLPLFS